MKVIAPMLRWSKSKRTIHNAYFVKRTFRFTPANFRHGTAFN